MTPSPPHPDIFFKKQISTRRAMKTHWNEIVQSKQVGRKKDLCKDCKWSQQLSYWCSGKFVFLEHSSMLNATPVTNAFLYCIGFFPDYVLGKHVDLSSTIFDSPVSVWVVFSPSTPLYKHKF